MTICLHENLYLCICLRNWPQMSFKYGPGGVRPVRHGYGLYTGKQLFLFLSQYEKNCETRVAEMSHAGQWKKALDCELALLCSASHAILLVPVAKYGAKNYEQKQL